MCVRSRRKTQASLGEAEEEGKRKKKIKNSFNQCLLLTKEKAGIRDDLIPKLFFSMWLILSIQNTISANHEPIFEKQKFLLQIVAQTREFESWDLKRAFSLN